MSFIPNPANLKIFDEIYNNNLSIQNMNKIQKGLIKIDWTREELLNEFIPRKVDLFFEHLEQYLPKDKIGNNQFARIRRGDDISVYVKMGNLYSTSETSFKEIAYDIYGNTPTAYDKLLKFASFDKNDPHIHEFKSLETRYVPVGNKFFDLESDNCELIDSTDTEELYTYAFKHPSGREINYRKMHIKDANNFLLRNLKETLGEDILTYVIDWIAASVKKPQNGNKCVVVIIGKSKSGKSTFVQALQNIGIASPSDNGSYVEGDRFNSVMSDIGNYLIVASNDPNHKDIDWDRIKKVVSDNNITTEAKHVDKRTIYARGNLLITANNLPSSTTMGLANKIVFMHSRKSYNGSEDTSFFEKCEKDESYDELISCILTRAWEYEHGDRWDRYDMPLSIKAYNNRYSHERFGYDNWFLECIEDYSHSEQFKKSIDELYYKCICYMNPSANRIDLKHDCDDCITHPTKEMKGYNFRRYSNFRSDLIGFFGIPKVINGNEYFYIDAPDSYIYPDLDPQITIVDSFFTYLKCKQRNYTNGSVHELTQEEKNIIKTYCNPDLPTDYEYVENYLAKGFINLHQLITMGKEYLKVVDMQREHLEEILENKNQSEKELGELSKYNDPITKSDVDNIVKKDVQFIQLKSNEKSDEKSDEKSEEELKEKPKETTELIIVDPEIPKEIKLQNGLNDNLKILFKVENPDFSQLKWEKGEYSTINNMLLFAKSSSGKLLNCSDIKRLQIRNPKAETNKEFKPCIFGMFNDHVYIVAREGIP